jgi:hypothetical protein
MYHLVIYMQHYLLYLLPSEVRLYAWSITVIHIYQFSAHVLQFGVVSFYSSTFVFPLSLNDVFCGTFYSSANI